MESVLEVVKSYGPTVIAAAAAAAAVLPPAKPGTAWSAARQLIDLMALNVGHARNSK